MRPLLVRCIVLLVSLATTASAGQQPPAPPPGAPAGSRAPAAPGGGSTALQPQGYTYDRAGRRDPFVSLLRRGAEAPGTMAGTRPAGLAGLGVSEVSLRGTLKGRDGFVAMLEGVDNKTYLVRPGDKLADGTVRTITTDSIVILQSVDDPLSLDTVREVRKMLRQTEEAK